MRVLTPAELAAWRDIPAAVVSDEREQQGVLSTIQPLFAGRPFAAQAFTIEVTTPDGDAPRAALARTWDGACIVIDARTSPDAAVWGGNLIRIARGRNVAAVVVDGSVRDVADLRDSGIAICSRGVTPRGPRWGGRVGGTILCGGVAIRAGDLIVGDDDGVVAVALEAVTDELLARCRGRLAHEEAEGRSA
jgi:4-hydroxy-4-methyl-2-oxoglutarate aldolase